MHVIHNDFGEVDVANIFIPFLVHVFAEKGISSTNIQDFAVGFNKLGDDIAEVGPFLIPVELVQVSEVAGQSYSAYRFSQKVCFP